jgi:hypothetical protein
MISARRRVRVLSMNDWFNFDGLLVKKLAKIEKLERLLLEASVVRTCVSFAHIKIDKAAPMLEPR